MRELTFSYISSPDLHHCLPDVSPCSHITPRSLRVLPYVFPFTVDWPIVSCIRYTVHSPGKRERHTLDWTRTGRPYRPTLFTTILASTLYCNRYLQTRTSQPCNNDGHCQDHSFYCALSLSHAWKAKENAIVYCHCSSIYNNKAVILQAWSSHSILQ